MSRNLYDNTRLINKCKHVTLGKIKLTKEVSRLDICLPQISLFLSETELDFKKLQFQLRLRFAMSIKKV